MSNLCGYYLSMLPTLSFLNLNRRTLLNEVWRQLHIFNKSLWEGTHSLGIPCKWFSINWKVGCACCSSIVLKLTCKLNTQSRQWKLRFTHIFLDISMIGHNIFCIELHRIYLATYISPLSF